jgi:hypothetical protein
MNKALLLTLFAILTPVAYADQGSFTNSGGSTSVSSGVTINSTVAAPPGSLTLNCPAIAAGGCAGGSLTYLSTDGTTVINASFTSGTFPETCSGGGKGGHVVCSYFFTGHFIGTLTVNGLAQAINGVTYQSFGVNGASANGATAYNSAYTPFYFSNSGQILRSDDLNGTNLISYGTQGGGVGQFYGAYGIALDSAGRIYISDTYNGRIVRIDDMNGTNWTSYGTWGSGVGQFMDSSGISVDSLGRIYVMDTGNNRLVRMDDMNGTNWTTLSALGSGVGQFAQYYAPVAFDASGRIYVADTGNRRIVRMDDLNGTNWITLTQSPVINGYIYSMQSPIGVGVDAAGKIYIADQESYQPAVIRVDDMTGTNWTSVYLGASSTPHSIAVDPSGMVIVGGGGAQIVDEMVAVLTSSSALTQFYGPYYVFGATLVPVPSPRPAAINFSPATLTFGNQNMGTSSAPQPVTIANFGGSPLNFSSITASAGFSADTSHCLNSLVAGTNCTVYVTFTPSVTGPVNGSLTIADNSFNLGSTQVVTLSGTGIPPAPVLSTIAPASGLQGQTLTTVTLAGTDLSGATVNAPSGFTVSNLVSTASQVTATFSIAWGAPLGGQSVTVTTAGGTSNSVAFTVNPATPPVPALSSISPTSSTQGANVSVMLKGTNFTSPATLNFDASGVSAVSATVVSSTTISAMIQIASNAQTGTQDVTVTTPGGTTGSVSFTVNAAPGPPAISSIKPSPLIQGGSMTVTVTGSNFVPGNTVINNSYTGLTITNVVVASSTSLSATFTVDPNAPVGTAILSVTTPFGTSTGTHGVDIAGGPSLTSISPASGNQGTAVTVALTGSQLFLAQVQISGTGITASNRVLNSSYTQLTYTFAIASGATTGARSITVNNAAGPSNAVTFTVNGSGSAPTLSTIAPASGQQGQTITTVTLTGTGLSGATINALSGITVSNVVATASQVTATFTLASGAPLGGQSVTVTTAGGTSNGLTFTVNPPTPVLSTIAPASGQQGQTITTVTLTGTGLSGATINALSGITVSNVVATASQVTATFTLASGALLGGQSVTVTTAGGTSNGLTFTVNASTPAPTLSSISPTSGYQNTSLNVTLSGTNFSAPATVNFGGTGVTVTNTTVVNSSTITATFTIASTAASGAQNVSVTTATGTSGNVSFTVLVPGVPTTTSISPNSVAQSSVNTITINGTNFIPGYTTVSASSTLITISNVNLLSSTQLTLTATIAANAPIGRSTLSVTTPGGTSASREFDVYGLPTLTSISPASGTHGTAVTVTLTGTQLFLAQVQISGTGITASNRAINSSYTQLTYTFTIASGATTGARSVTVNNAAGPSNAETFTVN